MSHFEFLYAAVFGDILVCENFEGDTPRYRFTANQYFHMRMVQKYYLTMPIGDDGRQLAITKELRKPVALLDQRANEILSGQVSDLKYLLYSSHDDAIANTIMFMQPLEHVLIDIPFASSIYMELHYEQACIDKIKDRTCFTVQVFHNNTPLKFDTCIQANAKRGSQSDVCQIDDFLAHWDKVKYPGDVMEGCAQPYVPSI
ncbi:hypothetical protein FGO68_gene16842 [Halteria grandinella]|uniref:Uncharacterized protein n=1 Tax=Halteria grandinella TaxID=5974 RepID=A0A8J8NN19_HALGN|nr:hypothetical protein FGO68_gene16842 [Halteria grandinella]